MSDDEICISLLRSRGSICPSSSVWATPCISVKKNDYIRRLCQGYRALNRLLVIDWRGLGDIQSTLDRLRGKRCFALIGLVPGFSHQNIAQEGKHKTAFHGTSELLWEANRTGFGLKCLSSACSNRVGLVLGDLNDQGMENQLD